MAPSGPREKGSRSCHCQGEIAPRVLADSSPKGASTSSFIHAAPGNCELVKRLPAPNLECTSKAPCDPALASRTLPPRELARQRAAHRVEGGHTSESPRRSRE